MRVPPLTLITPVKNGAAHLRACLDSVEAARAAGLSIEHIFVDGASTDGTLTLLGAAHDTRVFVEPALNPIEALDFARAKVGGAYALLLMADDVLADDFAASLAALFEREREPELALFACELFGDVEQPRVLAPPRRLWTVLNKYPGMNSALMRADLYTALVMPRRYYFANDRMMMLQLWSRARRIMLSDVVIARMRAHPQSMTNSRSANDVAIAREFTRMGVDLARLNAGGAAGAVFAAYAWKRALRQTRGAWPPLASLARLPAAWWTLARRADELRPLPRTAAAASFAAPFAFVAQEG